MLKKKKWPLFVILFLFQTSGCTPQPPDVPACEYLAQRLKTDPVSGHLLLSPSPTCEEKIQEPECGHCVWIVSGKELFIGEDKAHQFNGKPWSQLKQESVYLPAQESYAPLSEYVINSCKKAGCNDEVTKFKIKIDVLTGLFK